MALYATNTYTGPTRISNGKLVGVTGGSITSVVTNDNSAFGVLINDNTKQWSCTAVTFTGASTGLDFDFADDVAPSTNVAPLNVSGEAAFQTEPSVTVRAGNNMGGPGTRYPLMVWGSKSGTAPALVTINSLRGITGHLEVDGTTLMLVIDTSNQPIVWTQKISSIWDMITTNWVDGFGADTAYTQTVTPGDQVMFNEGYITANTTVTLNSPLSPANVTVSNTNYTYTITGTGAIAGLTSLTKLGAGILTLDTVNTYTGGTILSAGQLNLNRNTVLGTGRLTIHGGVIDNTSGADMTLSANILQSWNGDFTYIGSKSLNLGTGAVTLNNNCRSRLAQTS